MTIQDNGEATVVLGKKVVEGRFSENLIKVLLGILDLRPPIKTIIFDRRLQEVQVSAYEGPDFLFSIRFNPELNLASLKSLKEKNGLKGIQYVDLRVENKIFYKNL